MMERTASQRALEERLRVVEELRDVGCWQWDGVAGAVSWSAGLFRLLGLDAGSVQPNLAFYESLVHPKDRLALEEPASLATDGRQRDRRFRIIRPDGQLRWLQSRAQTVFDRAGSVLRVIAVVSDITEAKEVQRRAANDRALLDIAAQLLQVSFWIADEDGRLLDAIGPKDSGERYTDDVNATWREMVHPDDRDHLAKAWKEAVARRARYEFSPRIRMRDGTYQSTFVSGLPFDPEISSDPLWGGLSTLNPRALGIVKPGGIEHHLLSPSEVRACRALLDWSAEMLATKAGLSVSTVRRIESTSATRAQADSIRLIMIAFQQGGLAIWRSEDGRFCVSAA